jgi:hypothetical protein
MRYRAVDHPYPNATQFLIPCRGYHVQTTLGVTRVILELVILQRWHVLLQAEILSRIVE